MPQIKVKALLKNAQYLIKCGIYIACLLLITAEINSDKATKFTPKKLYFQSIIYAPQKLAISYCAILEMNDNLWKYLKDGLNFLETDGKNYPPSFIHPGGKAFGPLGLTQIAIEDVMNRCKELSHFNTAEVLSDNKIYESFAKAYADILLRHYLKVNYWAMPAEKVFDILQKAWFLGPGLYKSGRQVIPSRQQRAQNYKIRNNTNPIL